MEKLINPLADSSCYSFDDKGFGKAFADSYKDELRFIPEENSWYCYDGTRWKEDHAGMRSRECAKEYLDFLIPFTIDSGDSHFNAYVSSLKHNSKRKIMLDEAKSVHPLSKSKFDADKNLFNCLNFTINLTTCKPKKHDPNDFITKVAPVHYNKDARFPRFDKFTDEITCEDNELKQYLQKAYGYGITGETSEECLFVEYGPTTRNGKGTLKESVMNVLGDYALNMQPDSLAKRKRNGGSSPSPDIARNVGVRFINVNEPAEDMVLDAAMIKQLTGSDTVTARFLYGNSFDFIPQFKIYISTNHLPTTTDDTLFSSGRIKVIPFNRHFEESEEGKYKQDRTLKSLFRSEECKSAILNWLLDGLMMYRNEGMKPPKSVLDATSAYRQTKDTVSSFIESVAEKNTGAKEKKTRKYTRYIKNGAKKAV